MRTAILRNKFCLIKEDTRPLPKAKIDKMKKRNGDSKRQSFDMPLDLLNYHPIQIYLPLFRGARTKNFGNAPKNGCSGYN